MSTAPNQTRKPRKQRRSLSTRVRLALGMSMFAGSIILVGQLVGLIPDTNQSTMQARKLQTETLAITGSSVAETTAGLKSFHKTLDHTVNRNDDILTIGLRDQRTGRLRYDSGNHKTHWTAPSNNQSNDQFMFVPIYRDGREVAQLEICYQPLLGVAAFLYSQTVKLAFFIMGVSFFFFYWMLSRTLQQLDPRGAVPKRVREAFNTMAEGLLILNKDGQIMMANDKFGSLVGMEASDLVAIPIDLLSWNLPEHELPLPWESVLREGVAVSQVMLKIVDADFVERTFYISAAPVFGQNGSTRGVIVTFDDITVLEEQKTELVEARRVADEANDAKSQFLSRMTHELRTPMNAIIGYTDILRQGNVDADEQVRHLTTIQTSGEHLLALINDILDLSKVEAGQMTVEQRAIAVVPVVQNVMDTLVVKAREKGLELIAQIEGQIPHTIETDEIRLRQVLINIIGNAIKFTTRGGVRLSARMVSENQRHMLQFDIADTGIGMSKEALENIFDPFTQADSSITRKFGGTGLGLAISKQLTEALGGKIWVESEQGVGTIFHIAIDIGEIPQNMRWIDNDSLAERPLSGQTVAEPSMQQKFAGGHVLIVDDTAANRDLAALLLQRAGLTCDKAADGLEAIQMISAGSYDAVLMDVHMPQMDGLTATGHLRKAGLTELPVIALTAMASEEEKSKCLSAGCNGFLTKPIRMERVFEVLGEFLDVTLIDTTVVDGQSSDTCSFATIDREIDTTEQRHSSGKLLPNVIHSSLPLDEEFSEIVRDYADTLPQKLNEMEEALAKGDFDELKKLGHWLVGSSGTVGLDDFVNPGREIESAALEKDSSRSSELIDFCRELCKRIEVEAAV